MLGCIQPISSPMMKRMFGFCAGAWAYASVDQSPAHSEQAKSKVAQTNWPSLPLMMRFMMYLRRDSDRYCDAFSSGSFILLVCSGPDLTSDDGREYWTLVQYARRHLKIFSRRLFGY